MNSTEALKSFRGKRLKTQDDISNILNISRQAYCTYENNPLQCELNLIFKILESMNVDDMEIELFLNAIKQDYLSYKNLNESNEKEGD